MGFSAAESLGSFIVPGPGPRGGSVFWWASPVLIILYLGTFVSNVIHQSPLVFHVDAEMFIALCSAAWISNIEQLWHLLGSF